MITWKRGNLLDDDADALVNTVNCVGVMGKGIALQFKNRYPRMFQSYRNHCGRNMYTPGCCMLVRGDDGSKIINVASKDHWMQDSQLPWVQRIIQSLAKLPDSSIRSIALPPIGCGNGGLDWKVVKQLMIEAFQDSEIEYRIYEP